MRLTYVMPAPELRAMLSVYCDGEGAGTASAFVVPCLLGQVHIRTNGWSAYEFADGRLIVAPSVSVCGPFNQAFRMHVSADFRFIGLGLLSTGWASILGFPAADIADDVVDGEAIWPGSALAALTDQLGAEHLPAARGALLDRFVRARLWKARAFDQRIVTIDRWIETSMDLGLDRIMQALELSGRQVGRLTAAAHGCSPKLLSMKYRALRAAAALAVHRGAATDFAMDGYVDQSHFIKDFRRFVGWTPGAYLREQSIVARETLWGRWKLGVQRPLSLWS